MKIITIIWMAMCVQLSAIDADAQLITLHEQNSDLAHVLLKIRKQTGYNFLFNNQVLTKAHPVTVTFERLPLPEALDAIFKEQPLTYSIMERTIVIKEAVQNVNQIDRAPSIPLDNYIFMEDPADLLAVIRGMVSDESGEPLIGVNIQVKGTNRGTTTDFDGNYNIEADLQDTLVFSYVGYKRMEVPVNGRADIEVTLVEDVAELEELVVVGYGAQKKSDITGSISVMNEEQIKQVPVISLDQALNGQIAGVNAMSSSAEPGVAVNVRVRGTNSISSGKEPLYVIDGIPISGNDPSPSLAGVPTNPLATISTNDIESIEVLKDASATAIYGARGSNGVIIITTKRGSIGKAAINYSGYYGIQEVTRKFPMMNRDELIDYARASNDNADQSSGTNVYFPESISNETYPDIDYQDLVFHSAPSQNHQLSASGGIEGLKYYVSGSYLNQEGVVRGSNLNRYSAKANLDANLTSNLNIGSSISFSYTNNNRARTNFTTNNGGSVVYQSLIAYPYEPIYDEDGSFRYSDERMVSFLGNRGRPIPDLLGTSDEIKTSRFLSSLFAEYEIIQGLRFKTQIGTDIINDREDEYQSSISNFGKNNDGIAEVRENGKKLFLLENTLSFVKSYNQTHYLDMVGGFTYQTEIFEGSGGSSRGFIHDELKTYSLGSGTDIGTPYRNKSKSQLASFLGRINYKLFEKYLVTFTARADGSSKFGKDNKWGFFPSGALAWRAGEETFFRDMNIFSNLKFRTSYGLTGNQEIGLYRSLSRVSVGRYPINETIANTFFLSSFENGSLKWETTRQLDIGVDMGFVNHRLNFAIDYYQKLTNDQLLNVQLPESSGFGAVTLNTGEVENKGFEFSLDAAILVEEFQWEANGNFHLNRNEIIDLGQANSFFAGAPANIGYVQSTFIKEGIPLGSFYGWKSDGLFRNQAEVDTYLSGMDSDVTNDIKAIPGYPRVIDVNGDGRINSDDQTVIGNPYPDYEFGINNRFNYKNFSLNILLQGMIGQDIMNVNNANSAVLNFIRYNMQKRVSGNYWTEENPDAFYTKPSENVKLSTPQRHTDRSMIEDGTFVRLKNVTLGYTIPSINKVLSNAQIYFSVNNALTFTNYYGFDPEVNARGSADGTTGLNWGVDMSTYPQARTFIIGLNVGF